MNLDDALDIACSRHATGRYRWLCSEENPDAGSRAAYRDLVMRIAGEPPPEPVPVAPPPAYPPKPAAQYPPLLEQLGNAARAAGAFVADGLATVDDATYEARLATCRACEDFDAAAGRCRRCGCFAALKDRLRSQRCPIGKW